MTYLRICDNDDSNEVKAQAFRGLGRAVRTYANLTDRPELIEPLAIQYYSGQCRVYCEYDTIYLRVDDPGLRTYLAGMQEFKNRWRRPEIVRVFAAI